MAYQATVARGRGLERIFLLLITVVLALLFLHLHSVLRRDFADVPKRMADGSMINLNQPRPAERLRDLLARGYYFEDRRDIDWVRSIVARGAADGLAIDNIGELNKRAFFAPADEAYARGGESMRGRVDVSRRLLGFTGPDSVRFAQERSAPPALPAALDLEMGGRRIDGTVSDGEGNDVGGVLVRLELLLPSDSLYSNTVTEVAREVKEEGPAFRKLFVLDSAGRRQLQLLTAYTRTDASGEYSFEGLPEGKAFEVVPLQPGYQFGASRGTAELKKNLSFDFVRQPHTIRLFSTRDFNNLKREGALIVREPAEVERWYWIIAGSFLGAFWLLHLLLSVRFSTTDQLIVPVVMLLTGLSFLTLLSLQDPLRDRFLARSTLGYFGLGFVGLCILLLFDLRRLTVDSALYRLFLPASDRRPMQGWPWAALAGGLLLLTILFGTGPEGSGVKVNLFGFQPSELVKFSILLFLAGFFTANERFISEYTRWQRRWSFFSFALLSLLAVILLFLMLGDLGPAIVVCFTFIILFSFSRGDFIQMAGTVLLFAASAALLKNAWLATGITILALAAMTFLGKKGLSESSVMALAVLAGFLLLDQIPFLDALFPGPVERLVDRKAIWLDAWNNEVFGGDQVANGIWAMASGGLTGQGIGEGFAKTIPEAHTDMILPSLGEDFGLAGIVSVFILFLIYLHRSILIGRQTGTPFLFYLSAGIGIGTFVQFLLIAGGSTGVLPLSGVSLPFMSFGGSSLVLNLLAAGFLLSVSPVKGTATQLKYISARQDSNLVPALVAACAGLLLLSVNVARFLVRNEHWVVQPALVADRSGARMFSYNPRIAILMNRLQAGTLYDRKGLILATSQPALVRRQRDSLLTTGIPAHELEAGLRRRDDRFYPFGAHMFFWTGNENTGVFQGGTNGYFAEYEWGAELRGFPTPAVQYTVTASRFREDRFLPRAPREMTVVRQDYSALSPLLLAGINSQAVVDFKKRNRDLRMAVDARLQTRLQQSLAADATLRDNRVSVVVMQDSTGDVLASANYPLPPVDNWDLLTLPANEQNKLAGWLTTRDLGFTHATQPGSTAKLATALAAFNKLGPAAANKTFRIRNEDLIRIRSDEPDEAGVIGMQRALVKSNNPYFIKLANEEQLQEEMATLYLKTGMFLRNVGGFYFGRDQLDDVQQGRWRALWRRTEFRSSARYNPNDIRKTRGLGISGMAWGQGELIATPASVARLAAGIANNGYLRPNRYILQISDSTLGLKDSVVVANQPQSAEILTGYMIEQSRSRAGRLGLSVAGKTGTPERIYRGRRINDGWFVFFAPRAGGGGHIVVCVRIEGARGSSEAVAISGAHVIPLLKELGYVVGPAAPENPAGQVN